MSNPVLVEVTRGPRVESQHRGIVAIVDASGSTRLSLGDIAAPVFPRSAVKIFQALPLVESGAADAAGLTDAELALVCSSHNGEEIHVAGARSILAKAGLDEEALECGPQWPALGPDQDRLRRADRQPGAIYNNCSGKHAGFLCAVAHMGLPVAHYVDRDHPLQEQIHAILADITGAPLDVDVCGIDGCSIPTWAIPVERLAGAFAKVASGQGLSPARATALTRLRKSCAAHPFETAGTDRFCTKVMERFGEAAYVKTGAEGVYCAALPDLGLGVAIKIDDGATRGSEAVMAAVLQMLVAESDEDRSFLDQWARQAVETRRGVVAGTVKPSETLATALSALGR
ncbi:asparaginase [Amorphus sp. 3PC139-8]|uniref:asparaginase n=1 Tax=Amorphus sp. 3PC139-8 TaxID=2735676 RepID=UPI00345DC312